MASIFVSMQGKWFFIAYLFISQVAIAQQFGGNPPSIKWSQINTDTVRVIFPSGLEKKANDIVNIVHQLGQQTQSTIGNKIHKINIVLQNQGTISNAYVGLGPYRSEFLLTPMQNSFELGSIPWHQTLALHEYRHVQQFNNFRKGISNVFYVLAGELGLSFANNTAVPNWFWEGDAVFQETWLSEQGRGRLPYFFNGYRSLWSAGKNYSWMKLRNGSFRDYTPNHYQLGYMLIAYGREKYGADFWRKVTDDAVRFKGLFYPFQHAIRKYSGESFNQFTNEATKYFKDQLPLNSGKDIGADYASRHKHVVADEEFPQWIDEDHLLFVKSSFKKIPAFVIRNIKSGKDEQLAIRDISLDNYFSYRNGRVVYAAYEPDLRWGWKDYSAVRLLDINTGEQRNITHHTKYFAPDISENGEKIVVVQVTPDGNQELQVLETNSGTIMVRVPNKEKLFFTYPKFINEQQVITAVRNERGEMALARVDLVDGQLNYVVPFSTNVIGFPLVQGDTITFTASNAGHDKLFAIMGGKFYEFVPRAANRSTGNYQLSISGDQFAWMDFTAVGYWLLQEKNDNAFREINLNQLLGPLSSCNIHSLEQKKEALFLLSIPYKDFPANKFHKSFRLFNFHSWLPSIDDPDYTVSLFGENVLNTLQSELYFTYNRNEQSKRIGYIAAYGGLFPWIRFGTNYTKDRFTTFGGRPLNWDEWEGSAGFLIPLNLTGGKNYRSLRWGTDFIYNKRYFGQPYKDTFDGRGFGYIHTYLTFTNQIQQARQHIYPRFAQTIQLNYYNAVVRNEGHQLLASAYWYLPGLFINHNLVLITAFQSRDTLQQIRFTNSFPFSRGYSGLNLHRMVKLGLNYHLPLLYPDIGIAQVVYFMRVRANLFYDYTNTFDYGSNRKELRNEFRSYGAEIFFDTKWWNQHPVSFGIRYSRLLDGALEGLAPNQWEFILPVNLLNR